MNDVIYFFNVINNTGIIANFLFHSLYYVVRDTHDRSTTSLLRLSLAVAGQYVRALTSARIVAFLSLLKYGGKTITVKH